ncbi:MAG: hypothetical protein AAF630_00095 [Cyanobacteria bacterium P01_C01_bin.38]
MTKLILILKFITSLLIKAEPLTLYSLPETRNKLFVHLLPRSFVPSLWLGLPRSQSLAGITSFPVSGWDYLVPSLWLGLPRSQSLAGNAIQEALPRD